MDHVKVSIDLAALALEVEGPPDFATSVVDTFLIAVRERTAVPPKPAEKSESAPSVPNETSAPPIPSPGTPKKGANRRAKTFELLPDLLTPDTGRQLKAFFEEKQPKSQNDQALVLMKGLQTALGKKTFSYNELFTAFRSVGAPVPKSLGGVIGNLRLETLVIGTGDELTLHYTGEDHVDHQLPASVKPKKK